MAYFRPKREVEMGTNGDLQVIWQDHQPALTAFVRSRLKDRCAADDIVHEVYLKLRTRADTVRDIRKMRQWLYQVTRNAIMDHYRKHKKTVELPENLPAPEKRENAWQLISACVRPFIEELPPTYRDVLFLSEIEGLDQKQVAQRLGIKLANAKSRILRGKKMLKKKFDDCCIFKLGPRGAEVLSDTFGKGKDCCE